jgi:hypothetical protein
MGFVIVTNIDQAKRLMARFPAKAAKALSQAVHFAAKIAQGHVIQDLPKHFKIRSKWVPGSIRTQSLGDQTVAVGVLKGSAFMVQQETGGEKREGGKPMAIPIRDASSYASGATSPPFRGQDQMQQTLQGRWPSKLPKAFTIRTANDRNIVVQVKGRGKKSRLQVVYILKRRVKIKARWNFRETVIKVAGEYVPRLFMGYLGRGL